MGGDLRSRLMGHPVSNTLNPPADEKTARTARTLRLQLSCCGPRLVRGREKKFGNCGAIVASSYGSEGSKSLSPREVRWVVAEGAHVS